MNPMLRAGLYGRCLAFSRAIVLKKAIAIRATSTLGPTEPFFEKQKALSRPLSPHLTVYKWQITMVMSISHRITGLGLAMGVYAMAFSAIAVKGQFPEYIAALQAMHISPMLIIPAKLAASGTLFYHYFNGIRHLCWDLGLGFKIRELYASGAIVCGLTTAATLYTTFLL
ncbi:succinate dehydrogenase cytochrome b560 subunit [Tropilaelaps mercedesae]|uniref:Succinate dehydrogenase cytochrome b560 subunit n=1 Tax=Tropilaelaps mercedesae TaxID=418985 RepID=A0A1V9Y141_9ACAR|nr:succinate dehydrogenase cytochrome b560 subunit [Tropilaelaps mercedesae]